MAAFEGMTNITSLMQCPAFVTLANFTATSTETDVVSSMPTFTEQPPQNFESFFTVEQMSGRTLEMA
jgi:hypothetical protein